MGSKPREGSRQFAGEIRIAVFHVKLMDELARKLTARTFSRALLAQELIEEGVPRCREIKHSHDQIRQVMHTPHQVIRLSLPHETKFDPNLPKQSSADGADVVPLQSAGSPRSGLPSAGV